MSVVITSVGEVVTPPPQPPTPPSRPDSMLKGGRDFGQQFDAAADETETGNPATAHDTGLITVSSEPTTTAAAPVASPSTAMPSPQQEQPGTSSSSSSSTIAATTSSNGSAPRKYQTTIFCGIPVSKGSSERVFVKFVPYFNKQVQIFSTELDGESNELYRPIELSKLVKCSTNRISMFLKKWREKLDGIYQAIGYEHKSPEITCGLKLGAYFVSLRICQLMVEQFQSFDKNRMLGKGAELAQSAAASDASSHASSSSMDKKRKRSVEDNSSIVYSPPPSLTRADSISSTTSIPPMVRGASNNSGSPPGGASAEKMEFHPASAMSSYPPEYHFRAMASTYAPHPHLGYPYPYIPYPPQQLNLGSSGHRPSQNAHHAQGSVYGYPPSRFFSPPFPYPAGYGNTGHSAQQQGTLSSHSTFSSHNPPPRDHSANSLQEQPTEYRR
eukprot:TRINITY_DN14999_c0_g1_i2.p1 TRINITY_DN14999_c0_g1~~TRINITY_DN14999_c0_g1_i2.p1  ORF type:complete len:442 (-),score=65.38 TRINITY_DN14999_c0_g1_i2:42-1367(-)